MELGETCMFFFLYLELGETGSFSRLLFYIIYIIYTWNLEKLEVFFQTVILCYTWNCDKLQVYSDCHLVQYLELIPGLLERDIAQLLQLIVRLAVQLLS